jgi:hypothetical protein
MKKEFVLLVSLVLLLQLASAEVFISDVSKVYNLGDKFNVTVKAIPQIDTNDFLYTKLRCGGSEIDLHKAVYNVNKGQQLIVPISLKLDKEFLGSLNGDCVIYSRYGSDEKTGNSFKLSNEIMVEVTSDGMIITPGQAFNISGKAIKENGEFLTGIVEIDNPEINITQSFYIIDGVINISLSVPSNSPAGNYNLHIEAYDKGSDGKIINEGNKEIPIKIKQIPTKVEIAIDKTSIKPGEDFVYTLMIVDQSGKIIEGDTSVTISSPDKISQLRGIAHSGQAQSLLTQYNYTPGYWTVSGKIGNLENSRIIYIEQVENISYTVYNESLIISNTGNVPFVKPVEIIIGGKSNIEEINLDVGEQKSMRLFAPDGQYSVSIIEGTNTVELGTHYLTGNSISVKDSALVLASGFGAYIWMFLIMVLIVSVAVYYRRNMKRDFFGKAPVMESFKISRAPKEPRYFTPSVSEAESGNKESCGVVALKIKNHSQLANSDGPAPETLAKIVSNARQQKAKLQKHDDSYLFIFSPAITKNANTLESAQRFAKSSEEIISEHNKRYAQKIEFGIGVNYGDMIVEYENGAYNITSVGSTVVAAKRIAEMARGCIYLTSSANKRTNGQVKADKISDNVWKLNQIIDRGNHSKFINNFMKRQSKA